MQRLEIDTSEVDEESDNQLPLLLSVDIKLPSSFKTGKPRPANPIMEERLNIVNSMATQFVKIVIDMQKELSHGTSNEKDWI